MYAETLVLDPAWLPVARVSWQRAIALLWGGKVEVIEEYQDLWVRSVTVELRVPSVIRFLRGLSGRKRTIRFCRQNVYLRDRGSCQYCGRKVTRVEATYDHVVPRVAGGRTSWTNVVIACVACNQRKGGRTPVQARMVLKSHPVKPNRVPAGPTFTMMWRKDMPEAWRTWLRDAVASVGYWQGELEQD